MLLALKEPMLALVRPTPGLCASGRAISTAPERTIARPAALAGARVTRASEDKVETLRRSTALFDVGLSDFEVGQRYTVSFDDDRPEQELVARDLTAFDESLAQMRAMKLTGIDVARATALLDRARNAVETHARDSLARTIAEKIERARAGRDRAVEYALDCVDEAISSQREAVARAGAIFVDRTVEALAPTMTVTPLALVDLGFERRVSRWRVSCGGHAATIEWRAYAASVNDGARCARCEAVRRRFTVCGRCGDARCDRCALWCEACGRWSCGSCASRGRCPSCGASPLMGAHQ
jgi:hypothetical protein